MVAFKLMFILVVCGAITLSSQAKNKQHQAPIEQLKDIQAKVRSFSFEDTTEDNNVIGGGGEIAGKRTIYKSVQEEFPMVRKESIKTAFKDALGTVLELPTEENAFDGAGDSLVAMVNVFQKYGGNIFKQLAKKLKVKTTGFYNSIVSQNKDEINLIINNKKITKQEWVTLRDTKYRFFPSQKHYSSTEYTKDFFPDIMGFAIVFVAGTLDLTMKGEAYKCQLSKELDLLKNDVETAIQALIYKRLDMLEPESSSWRWIDISISSGRDKINYKDKFTGELLCKDGCILNDGEGMNPVVNSIMGVASTVLDDASQVFDFLDRFFVQLTNKKAFCFDGCVCPKEEADVKIERGDYVKDFPWSCLGNPSSKNKKEETCKLPCGKYGESYNWCPTELEKRASQWDFCNKAKQACVQGWYKKK